MFTDSWTAMKKLMTYDFLKFNKITEILWSVQ